MGNYKNRAHTRIEVQAAIFSFFIMAFLCVTIVTAFASAGPIVLGTEMNTNGMVEYMCLGNGCEGMTEFTWNDK